MSKKRYLVKYDETITAFSTYAELMDILKGGAMGKIVTTRISDNMPVTLHNTIADHNSEVEKQNNQP